MLTPPLWLARLIWRWRRARNRRAAIKRMRQTLRDNGIIR
jgi:hypothetical protein